LVGLIDSSEWSNLRPILAEWDQKFFPFPWRESHWNSLVYDYHALIAAYDQDKLCGFSLFNTSQGVESYHLLKIYVVQDSRKKGLASDMIKYSIKKFELKQIYLEVAVNNIAAIALYESLGFEKLLKKDSFYSDGSDAFAMLLKCD
tara:strand:- start:18703 stop:19140 length:438 start_codon:yes stop_codon:yes gene_type:complete